MKQYLETLEPNVLSIENPFIEDCYHMGLSLDSRYTIMYASHGENKYIIVVCRKTGKRVKIKLSELFD